jgi:DNA adenine methylase
MQYMGGKARIARRMVEAILADTEARGTWVEPFVGGGNVMEHAAPNFGEVRGYDLHPDLIMMWAHVASGGQLPETVTREMYAEHRHAQPSWLRGFLGFGASFGGKWFGGYGVSPRDGELWRQSARTVARQAAVFQRHGVRFEHADYATIRPESGSVVYCDPPYLGTTAYATGGFDHKRFYQVLQGWAADCFVYVSEYQVLPGVQHKVIWEHERRTSLKKDVNAEVRTEKLFRILPESWPWP